MKKIFDKIKCWFQCNKLLIKKILVLLWVFLFGCGVGGCVEEYCSNKKTTTNIETVSTCAYSDISSQDATVELGLKSQVLFISSNNSSLGYSSRHVTASLPLTLFVDYTNYRQPQFQIIIGSESNPISNSGTTSYYQASTLFANTSTPNGSHAYGGFGFLVDGVDFSDNIMFRYVKNSTTNKFGFQLPSTLYTTSQGLNGNCYTEFLTDNFTTFFYFGHNGDYQTFPTSATRLIKHKISYINFLSLDYDFNFNGSSLVLPYFEIHTFTLDNGYAFQFGMPIIERYSPETNNIALSDITYYFGGGDFEEGRLQGLQEGYNNGFRDGDYVGYDRGVSEALEDVLPTKSISSMVSQLLSVKLFGDVSLGVVLSLVFGILLLRVIITVFLGG